jgi:hypothetical protein
VAPSLYLRVRDLAASLLVVMVLLLFTYEGDVAMDVSFLFFDFCVEWCREMAGSFA